jgi:hypothetical protein
LALCGGSMAGAIAWALHATDIHSGWTEVPAVWNRGGHATRERLSEIQAALPFSITKLDFDNGTEFLNAHFITHFKAQEPKIELSRSRPYRENDNAHIEQKNDTHVRVLLGDDRFEHCELVEALNEVPCEWSLWNNLYAAQRRLRRKERQANGKVKRYHEQRASTPCARLLARNDLSQEQRQKLRAVLCTLDPITMRASIESKLQTLYRQRARLPRLTALQPAFPRAESNAKTGLANPSEKRQTNPCHGVPHREAPSHLLKSSSASSFNEASRSPRGIAGWCPVTWLCG